MRHLRISAFARGLALIAMTASGSAQAAACLTPDQMQSIAVAALPDALGSARRACLAHLPASAALTRSDSRIANVYRPAADKAWPDAAQAFLATADLPLPPGSDPAFVRPLLTTIITSMVEQEIKPADCGAVEEFYGALEPLPPQNVGKLLVAILKMDAASKKADEQGDNPFTICKDAPQ